MTDQTSSRSGQSFTVGQLSEMTGFPIPVVVRALASCDESAKDDQDPDKYHLSQALPYLALMSEAGHDMLEVDGDLVKVSRVETAKMITEYYRSLRMKTQYDLDMGAVLDKEATEILLSEMFSSVAGVLDSCVDQVDRAVGLSPKSAKIMEQAVDVCRNQMYDALVRGSVVQAAVDAIAQKGRSEDNLQEGKRMEAVAEKRKF